MNTIELIRKKDALIDKAYKELNVLREKALNLSAKEDIFFAGGEYAYMEDIACILKELLEEDYLKEEDVDSLLPREHLLEKIYEEWTSPKYGTPDNIAISIFITARSKDYDWEE